MSREETTQIPPSQAPYPPPYGYFPPQEDEINLGELMQKIWATRRTVLLFLLVTTLIVTGVWSVKSYTAISGAKPEYQFIVDFTFDGVDNNQHPNQSAFYLTDLIAPAVLTRVYKQNNLEQYELSLTTFISNFSIIPYTPTRELIIEKYSSTDKKKDKNIVATKEAQQALEAELNQASRRSALISYIPQDAEKLPTTVVTKILRDVPSIWADKVITEKGVLRLNLPLYSEKLFDPSILEGKTNLLALQTVTNRTAELKATLVNLLNQPAARNTRDTTTNHTAADLQKLLQDTEQQLVEIPRNWPASSADKPDTALLVDSPLYSPTLFNPNLLEELDYLISLDVVSQRIKLVQQNINRILDQTHGAIVVDPVSGITAYDLDRLLVELEEFDLNQLRSPVLELGISKAPDLVRFYYKVQIRELERKKSALIQKAKILQDANQRYQGNSTQGYKSTGSAQETAGGQPSGIGNNRGTVIPQLGDAFLDRLIELSNKGDSTAYLQNLNNKTIKIEEEVADTKKEIVRAKDILKIFNQVNSGTDKDSSGLRDIYIAKMQTTLPAILEKLRHYTEITQRLSAQLRHAQDISNILSTTTNAPPVAYFLQGSGTQTTSETLTTVMQKLSLYGSIINNLTTLYSNQYLSTTGNLYVPTADVSIVDHHPPLIPKKAILTLVLAGILAIMLGIAVGLFQQATRRDSTSDG